MRPAFATSPYTVRPSQSRHGICALSRQPRVGGRLSVRMVSNEVKAKLRTGNAHNISVILLAGGVGKRMKAEIPKQLLPLCGQSVLERSLYVFIGMAEVSEVIVVLDRSLRDTPVGLACKAAGVIFADPGVERSDSVRSGCAVARTDATLICVHDAARPLVRQSDVRAVLDDGWRYGAAALAVPCKATIKSSNDGYHVTSTLDRSLLWEMQTPQCIDANVLRHALTNAYEAGAVITDDVSAVERMGYSVRLTQGHYDNIKITTPEDLIFAKAVLSSTRADIAQCA